MDNITIEDKQQLAPKREGNPNVKMTCYLIRHPDGSYNECGYGERSMANWMVESFYPDAEVIAVGLI